MGELRAAIEALSDLDLPPDQILERLHDQASRPQAAPADTLRPPEEAAPATCLYLVYDPISRLCTAASAGHPPPVLVRPDGQVDRLDVAAGPALGQGIARYRVCERTLPEASTLLIYNTALISARSITSDSLQESVGRLFAVPHASLQSVCDAAVSELGPERPYRDAYLLLVRTRTLGPDNTNAWTFANSPEIVSQARKKATDQLTRWGVSEDVIDNTVLIVSELVTNAVRYSEGPIELRLILGDTLVCEITDDSNTAPHLRRALNMDENGRGLFITAQLTQRWGVRPADQGKTLWAEQALTPTPTP
jgi:anti-sigma regulatory factor (Ser/Thr protein kinase)